MEKFEQSCFIWQTPAEVQSGDDSYTVDSPRAGGCYRITDTVVATLNNLPIEEKARLTWWLVEQRRQGESCPTIASHTFEYVRALPAPSIVDRRDRILDFIAGSSSNITPRIVFAGVVTERMRRQKAALAASSGSQNDEEVNELVQFLREDNLIGGSETLHLTFKAW